MLIELVEEWGSRWTSLRQSCLTLSKNASVVHGENGPKLFAVEADDKDQVDSLNVTYSAHGQTGRDCTRSQKKAREISARSIEPEVFISSVGYHFPDPTPNVVLPEPVRPTVHLPGVNMLPSHPELQAMPVF
jgi:hypothetical protein